MRLGVRWKLDLLAPPFQPQDSNPPARRVASNYRFEITHSPNTLSLKIDVAKKRWKAFAGTSFQRFMPPSQEDTLVKKL